MSVLFEKICTLVFTYPDKSAIQCHSTLNPDILKSYNCSHIDSLIDFDSFKIIPDYLFEECELSIYEGNVNKINDLDNLFERSVKRLWESSI